MTKTPPTQPRKPTEAQLRKRRTMYVTFIMLIPLAICVYLIYGGGQQAERTDTLRDLPDGEAEPLVGDKRKAVEQRTATPSRSLGDSWLSLLPDSTPAPEPSYQADAVEQSRQAYRAVTQQVSGFYAAPATGSGEVESLHRQVRELTAQLQQREQMPPPDPATLMEKSYELAARYLGTSVDRPAPVGPSAMSDKSVERVGRVPDRMVSSLAPPGDTLTLELTRRNAFYTAVGGQVQTPHHAIRACVAGDQTVRNGERITLRLGHYVPAGTMLYGTVRLSAQRMGIEVSSIDRGGSIIPVSLTAYDMDGQPGLFVPNSAERNALKDAAASIGGSLGSNVSFTRSAGQQIAMDVVRGAMTGGSQYLASKLREVKITVKTNYQLYLIPSQ